MESPTKSFTVRQATLDDIPSLTTIVPRSFHPTNPYILKVSLQGTLKYHQIYSIVVLSTTLDNPLTLPPAPPKHSSPPQLVDRNLHLQAPIPNNIPPPHSILLHQPILLPRRPLPPTHRPLRPWRRILEQVSPNTRPRCCRVRRRCFELSRRPRSTHDGPATFCGRVVRR